MQEGADGGIDGEKYLIGRRTPDAVLLRGEGRHRSPRDRKMVCVRLLQWRRINIGNI